MQKVIQTVLNVGLEKPVKILQITDIHLVEYNEKDPPEQQKLLQRRWNTFRKEGWYPPKSQNEYFEEAIRMAEEEGALLICTGDATDLHSQGNREEFHRITKGHDMMFAPGGHETQQICRRTMEEEYPYVENTRPQVMAEYPQFKWDFDSRIINGLNIITADNALDYFNQKTVELFKKELERGLPIVIFFHDPITDRRLNRQVELHPNERARLTDEDIERSLEMVNLIKTHPLVKGVFAGHLHCEHESVMENGSPAYITPGLYRGMCRFIEIR